MLPVALALLPTLYQMGKSVAQRQKASELQQSNYIPPSVQNAVATARQMSEGSVSMPGYNQAVDRLKTTTANTIANSRKVAGNSAQLSQDVANASARENQSDQSLSAQNSAFKFSNLQNLQKWLGIRGGYEAKNRDQFNAAKSALTGAADQNMYNGISSAASIGLAATDKDLYSSLYGKNTLGAQPTNASNLGGVGNNSGSVLGAAGNNSILGKNGIELAKAIRSRNGASFDDNEKAYLQNLGYSISPSGEVINMESPNLEVFAQ